MDSSTNDSRGHGRLTVESTPWVRKTFWALVVFLAFITFLDYGINFASWTDDEALQDMFNVAREGSLGNWYSSTIQAAVGAALWVIYVRAKSSPVTAKGSRGWAVLSLFFFYLSIDDGIRFHEEMAGFIQDWWVGTTEQGKLPPESLGPIGRLLEANPSYPWLIVFAPFIGALGLYMVWFLWRNLDRRSVKRVVIAVFCLALAEAQDFVEGIEGSYDAITKRFDLDDYTAPHYGKVFEETLESLAMTILFCVFLGVIAKLYATPRGSLAEAPEAQPAPLPAPSPGDPA